MKCKNCGTEFEEGLFCPECGTQIDTQVSNTVKEQNIDENNSQIKKKESWFDKFCSLYYNFSDRNNKFWKKIFKTICQTIAGVFGFWLLCQMFNWSNPVTRFIDNILYSVLLHSEKNEEEKMVKKITNDITSNDTVNSFNDTEDYSGYKDIESEDIEEISNYGTVQYTEDFDYEEGGINNPLEIEQLNELYLLNDSTITVGITDEFGIKDLYLYQHEDNEYRPKYTFYSMIPVKLLYDINYNSKPDIDKVSERYLEIYRFITKKGDKVEFKNIDNTYIDGESKIDSFEILRNMSINNHYLKFDYIINEDNIDYDYGYIKTTSYNDNTGRTENVIIDTSYCPDVLELKDGIIKMYCVDLYTIGERDHAFALLKYKKENNNKNKSDLDEYICPNSDTIKLTIEEIKKLSKTKNIRLAKNEIYARHGRKFKDNILQEYFNSKSWYKGIIEPENFDEDVFNEIEKYNIRLLAKYE